MTDTNDRREIALHEAGHALAHVRLLVDHDGAHILSDEEAGLLGAATGAGVRHVWGANEAKDMVIAFCAGNGALKAAGYPEEVALAGTGDDFEQAQDLLDFWGIAGDLSVWKDAAVELMRRPENVAAVALIAQNLLDRDRLDGELVEVLVNLADGEATEEDFQRYLLMRGLV